MKQVFPFGIRSSKYVWNRHFFSVSDRVNTFGIWSSLAMGMEQTPFRNGATF